MKYKLIWGSGRFRASDVYLAYMPLDRIEHRSSIVYYAGSGYNNSDLPRWTASEEDAVPVLSSGCVGELSVRWNDYLDRWVMLYRNDNPFGIVSRTAELPWGPWTTPSVIFDACENRAYVQFMHCGDKNCCGAPYPGDLLSDAGFEWMNGSEYAPYQIAPYATGIRGQYTRIYFTLSTWNPYQVMQMETIIPVER